MQGKEYANYDTESPNKILVDMFTVFDRFTHISLVYPTFLCLGRVPYFGRFISGREEALRDV